MSTTQLFDQTIVHYSAHRLDHPSAALDWRRPSPTSAPLRKRTPMATAA
jgi:hypothetical protein